MAPSEPPPQGEAHNESSGSAHQVVQARDIQGGVHVHQRPVSSVPVPRQLPPDATHFTNRTAELAELDALLGTPGDAESATVAILAIAGTGGVGKTSLAAHWAHRVRDQFPDGALYVNLRGYDTGEPVAVEQVLDGFLRALDVPGERIPQGGADALVAYYRSLLAGRRMLVMLDNVATAEQVRPLVPGSPTCLVIVTSRSRLSGLVARDGARRITLNLLTPDEGITLLRQVIGAARVDAEPEAAAELARRCAYLPLALRIAAERVAARPHRTVDDLVEELAVERDRLDVLAADDDDATAVRTVFSWSYQALPAGAARVFRLLGLHPGPEISAEAAAALAGSTTAAVRRLLDLLTGVHLLHEIGRDRYEFHDLLRAYAAECAAAEESESERTGAVRRVLAWYLHTGGAADRVLYPHNDRVPLDAPDADCQPLVFTGSADATRWFDAERENLLAAIHAAVQAGEHFIAGKLPAVLQNFWFDRFYWTDVITIQHIAVTAAQRLGDRHSELRAHNALGDIYNSLQQLDKSMSCFQRVLVLALEVGDQIREGWAVNGLGAVHRELGNLDEAATHCERASAVFDEIGDQRGKSSALVNLGEALRRLGRFDEAIGYLRQSLAIHRQNNYTGREAWVLHRLGLVCLDLRQTAVAIDHFQQALVICRNHDLTYGSAYMLQDLGEAHYQAGQRQEARESWRMALAIFDDLGNPRADQIRARLQSLEAAGPDQHQ